MAETAFNPVIEHNQYAQLVRENEALKAELAELKQQLAWFKRQLFGRKSEKRLVDDGTQTGLLFEALPAAEVAPPTEEIKHTRRKGAKDRGESVTDAGLRFTDDVPVEVIEVRDPEIEAIPEQHRSVIGEKVTHRLAQRPGSYVVLAYRRQVVKDTRDERILTPAVPANVL